MSNQYFEIKWRQSIKDFQDTYEIELEPLKQQLQKQKPKNNQDWFNHYSLLYLKYLQIYRNLEECYEFCNNPQKKQILREMMLNSLKRTLLVKKDLIRFNTFTPSINSDFVEMESLLENNKISLKNLEIPIPKFFISEVNYEREDRIKQLFEELNEFDVYTQTHPLYKRKNVHEISMIQAIYNILNIERLRQAIENGNLQKEKLIQILKKHEMVQQDQINQINDDQKKKQNIIIIQKFIRGFFQRKLYFKEKSQETYFLELNYNNNKIKQNEIQIQNILDQRKQQLKEMDIEIDKSYISIKENLLENEGIYIKELMLDERRNFIIQRFEEKNGKELPENIQEFYKQNEQINIDDKQKNQKPKQQTKLTDEEQFLKERIHLGPENSVELKNLKNLIQRYNNEWGTQINLDDNYINRDIIIQKIYPEIKQQIQTHVDQIISIELDNLYDKLKITKKKEPKQKKINIPKPPKIPGENLSKDQSINDIAQELIQFHIWRKEEPKKIYDFLTTENLIKENLIQNKNGIDGIIDPSLAQLKRCISENIIIPLGSGINPEFRNRTFLFYGSQGTGKNLMTNIISTETNSIMLDISPYNLVNIFTDKISIQKIMYKVFKIAKEFQPAVIFFNEVEHFFGKKNLKKQKQYAGKCNKFKKELQNQINKHLTPEDKVVIIGFSQNPQFINIIDAKKFFYKKFYFPLPDYSSRRQIFQILIENQILQYQQLNKNISNPKDIQLDSDFPFSLLAYHTEGFSIGTMKKVIKKILTPSRLERIEINSLKPQEFIEPLAEENYSSQEIYQQYKEFTWVICGFKELNDRKILIEKENAKNQKKR